MITGLTLLAMAVATSQAATFGNVGTYTDDGYTDTTTHESTTRTTTRRTTTKRDTITTDTTSDSTDTTSDFTDTITSSSTTTTISTTHASSTITSTTTIHDTTSNLASSTKTRGTTVTPMLPTLTASSSLSTSSSSSTALAEQAAPSSSSSLSGGAIGGIIAAVAVLIIGAGALLLVHRKKERRRLRAERNKADPFTMGFGSYDPKPMSEQYEVTHEPIDDDEDLYKEPYEPQLSPSPRTNNFSVNAAAAATVLASPVAADPSVAVIPIITAVDDEQLPIGSYTVIATYIPTQSDELELAAGDQIDLIVEYDDGWCQGVNISKGHTKGVFPRHCIDYATAPSDHKPNIEVEKSKRVSSMYVM